MTETGNDGDREEGDWRKNGKDGCDERIGEAVDENAELGERSDSVRVYDMTQANERGR